MMAAGLIGTLPLAGYSILAVLSMQPADRLVSLLDPYLIVFDGLCLAGIFILLSTAASFAHLAMPNRISKKLGLACMKRTSDLAKRFKDLQTLIDLFSRASTRIVVAGSTFVAAVEMVGIFLTLSI